MNTEESSLMGYDAVSLSEQFPRFQPFVVPSSSWSCSPTSVNLLCKSDIAFHHKTLGSHSLLNLKHEALINHIDQQCIQ